MVKFLNVICGWKKLKCEYKYLGIPRIGSKVRILVRPAKDDVHTLGEIGIIVEFQVWPATDYPWYVNFRGGRTGKFREREFKVL